MNVTNSIVLLLCLLLSFGEANATDFVAPHSDEKESKEIIIIQIDDNLDKQLTSLASYTFDLYKRFDHGIIKITAYTDLKEEKAITELTSLLGDKGLTTSSIVIENKELELDQAYFTISVSSGPAVQ